MYKYIKYFLFCCLFLNSLFSEDIYSVKSFNVKTEMYSSIYYDQYLNKIIYENFSFDKKPMELRIDNYFNGKGRVSGNQSSQNLVVLNSIDESINFIEITASGSIMVLTIYNIFNKEKDGYFFLYTRTLSSPNFTTTYTGYAKPMSYYYVSP